ncbi:polyhydroxyalkanoate synthesis regulator DNA-binding domain-containing protein [Lyticum sinuosum]|nr:polyhydroxyalkanoate synthesis regulator DNA-binding domain-containing protein [Lyticum sinuosum]
MNKVLIKKYINRRLYNMSSGCYIVYNDLIKMIKEGIKVKIVDVQSEVDITVTTVLHALAEYLNHKDSNNSNVNAIKDNSDVVQEVVEIILNNENYWITEYSKLIINYLKEVQRIYKSSDKKSYGHIDSFTQIQKLSDYNRNLTQQLIDLARQHFS